MSKIYRVRWAQAGKSFADAFTTAEDAFNFALRKQRALNVYDIVFETASNTELWYVSWVLDDGSDGRKSIELPAGSPPPDMRLFCLLFAWMTKGPPPRELTARRAEL